MSKVILEQVIKDSKNHGKWNQFFYSACSYYSTADIPLGPPKDSRFSNLKTLGEIAFDRLDKVIVVTFDISQDLSERSGKKAQYEEAKRALKSLGKYPAGLFIFTDPQGQFRMSLVYAQYQGTKIEFSNFRRFTYLVDPELTNRTFLNRVGLCKFDNLESIKDAFSVEKVNKEFYLKIADFFYQLTGSNGKKPQLMLPDDLNSEPHAVKEFAIRLIGRIIFCWFLKHKRSPSGTPLIPEEVLSKNAVKEHYYHMVLERLFFELMNKPVQNRQPDIGIYVPQHTQIPFLNGGLFDPHEDDFYQESANWGLKIPDNWFTGFFEVLEHYNFTIDENSPVDAEVSVDPEMMGRIFENLLAEINPETGESARKATGSYYTPRVIVDYMVEQSLKQYLLTDTSLNDTRIDDLLSYEKELTDWASEDKEAVVKAFNKIKVLDPACGSGAFPMGILQRMIVAMEKVDPDLEIWLNRFLSRLDTIARQTIEKHIQLKNWAYIRKLTIIRDSIYGVDIQPIAVEIAKLRCFLSLVVDEIVSDTEPNRGIETLPNLEFKFVAANSLIALPGAYKYNQPKGEVTDKIMPMPIGEESELIGELASLRKEYFTSYGERKKEIEKVFSEIQQQMIEAIAKTPIASATNLIGDTTKLEEKTKSITFMLAGWKPFSNEASKWFDPEWMFGVYNGFDIVIGNAREVFGLTARNRINKGFPGHTPLFLCPETRAVRNRMAA